MNIQEYIEQVKMTEKTPEQDMLVNLSLFDAAMTLFSIAGKILNLMKRVFFYQKSYHDDELNDLLFLAIDSISKIRKANSTVRTYKTPISWRFIHGVVGIATESSELVDLLQYSMNITRMDNTLNLIEELGDLAYYEALLFDQCALDQGDIRSANIAKLRKRYPEGFTQDKAINRDIKSEMEVLERYAKD